MAASLQQGILKKERRRRIFEEEEAGFFLILRVFNGGRAFLEMVKVMKKNEKKTNGGVHFLSNSPFEEE